MAQERGDNTRYGFPPQGDVFARLPAQVPWDTPISELAYLWLDIRCCNGSTGYPLRLLAAERGWKLTLRSIIPKLKCKVCENHPESVHLTTGGSNNRDAPRHALWPPSTVTSRT